MGSLGTVSVVMGLLVASSAHAQATPATPTPLAPLGGGLLPPPAPETPEAAQTVQALEQAEREDSGRGLSFVWLNVEPAISYTNLTLFSDSSLLDNEMAKASTLGLGVAGELGVRFLYLSLAARFRYLAGSDFDEWNAALLASLRVPLGRLEPYVSLGGGFVRVFGFEGEQAIYGLGAKRDDLVVSGAEVLIEGGLDYYVTPVFSVGVEAEVAALFLGRSRVVDAPLSVYDKDGSGVGFGVNGSVVLGLHF